MLQNNNAIIHIVDDDELIRESLAHLLRSVGYGVNTYGSAYDFLQAELGDEPGCLVLDVRLPGASGLELQEHLAKRPNPLPVILMTGFGDIRMSVRAMKAGAVDFLEKPFRDQDMLDAVVAAMATEVERRGGVGQAMALRERYASLTRREREVMTLVASGQMNKQVAASLSISEVTVKIYRSAAMRKMEAKSLAELARMAEILGLGPEATNTFG